MSLKTASDLSGLFNVISYYVQQRDKYQLPSYEVELAHLCGELRFDQSRSAKFKFSCVGLLLQSYQVFRRGKSSKFER